MSCLLLLSAVLNVYLYSKTKGKRKEVAKGIYCHKFKTRKLPKDGKK